MVPTFNPVFCTTEVLKTETEASGSNMYSTVVLWFQLTLNRLNWSHPCSLYLCGQSIQVLKKEKKNALIPSRLTVWVAIHCKLPNVPAVPVNTQPISFLLCFLHVLLTVCTF